jgi:molecular chaperone DnaK
VKSAFDKLTESQGKLGEAIYASSQAEAAASETATESSESTDEDIVDAEVVDDEDDAEEKK